MHYFIISVTRRLSFFDIFIFIYKLFTTAHSDFYIECLNFFVNFTTKKNNFWTFLQYLKWPTDLDSWLGNAELVRQFSYFDAVRVMFTDECSLQRVQLKPGEVFACSSLQRIRQWRLLLIMMIIMMRIDRLRMLHNFVYHRMCWEIGT